MVSHLGRVVLTIIVPSALFETSFRSMDKPNLASFRWVKWKQLNGLNGRCFVGLDPFYQDMAQKPKAAMTLWHGIVHLPALLEMSMEIEIYPPGN